MNHRQRVALKADFPMVQNFIIVDGEGNQLGGNNLIAHNSYIETYGLTSKPLSLKAYCAFFIQNRTDLNIPTEQFSTDLKEYIGSI